MFIEDLLLALLPALTVHWPPHMLSPSMTGDIDGRAAPSCRRCSCPRSGAGVDGPGGMSGDVLPPAGGKTTATHGDVLSSPMVGRKLCWGRQGEATCLPRPPVKPVDMSGLPQVVVVTVQVVSVVGSDVAGEMGENISPKLPDGLPLVVWGRLGSLARGDVLDPLVLMPPASCDAGLPVPLGDGLPRGVRRAATALFPTGAQVGPAVVTTPPLDVVLGGGPPTVLLRLKGLGLPTTRGWSSAPSSSDDDDRIISTPRRGGRGETRSRLAVPSLFSSGAPVARFADVAGNFLMAPSPHLDPPASGDGLCGG